MLENVKKYLQHGEIALIAKDLKLSESYVGAVLAGKKPLNLQILEKATEYAEKNKAIIEKAESLGHS